MAQVGERQHGVVLTYSAADFAEVTRIYDELKRRGLEPWIDSVDNPPGSEWRKGITQALQRAPAALVFLGRAGPGKWQDQELSFIHEQCVERGITAIPVLLPGGSMPDDLFFSGRMPVRFRVSDDTAALDQIEFGVTGVHPRTRRGKFEIIAPVSNTEPDCFLAVSHATSKEVFTALAEAANDAGLLARQARQVPQDGHSVYEPNVVLAIRSASLIIADGTPDPATGKPDADVMYEVGMGQALAKPIVFISTPPDSVLPLPIFVCSGSCERIDYDPDNIADSLEPLKKELSKRLRKMVAQMRPPHIMSENNLGLSVAYSELHQHRAEFWPPFEQVMHYGLSVKRVFWDILREVHRLQEIMTGAYKHAEGGASEADLVRALTGLRAAYERFCEAHTTGVEQNASLRSSERAAEQGFDRLTAILADPEEAVETPVLCLLRASRTFFDILKSYFDEYLRSHDCLLRDIGSEAVRPLRHIIQLHSQLDQLARHAEAIPAQACEMMFHLLELVGHRNEGGAANV